MCLIKSVYPLGDIYSSDAFLYLSDIHLCIRSLQVYRYNILSSLRLKLGLRLV